MRKKIIFLLFFLCLAKLYHIADRRMNFSLNLLINSFSVNAGEQSSLGLIASDVILIKDVPGLGFKNEIVKIKNGYGRNYLIPKGYAILANSSNSKILNEILKQTKNKQEEILNKSKELSKNISELIIDIPVKVGSENKIFGTITTAQISDLLNKKGFDINKKNISILSKIKNIGTYDVNLSIHKEITHPIKINVIPNKKTPKKEKVTKKTSETKTTNKKK